MAWFFLVNGDVEDRPMVVDTVMLEPDEKRFTVTSRTSLPFKRNMFEMELVVVGRDPHEKERMMAERAGSFPIVDSFEGDYAEETTDD
jgi:hypothetical protein